MERQSIIVKPSDLLTPAKIDSAVSKWIETKRGPKSPLTDEYIPSLNKLLVELVIPSMNSGRNFDLRITGRELTDQKMLYDKIVGDLPRGVKNILLKTAKVIAVSAFNEAMKAQKESFAPLTGNVPGDAELTERMGRITGGARYSNWDAGASVDGYDQGLGDARNN